MTFGEYIKTKRIENNMTLRGLAKKLSITAPYLSDVEKGRRYQFNKEKLEEVASLFKLSR